MISVEELLKPVSPEQPCGEDCSYHPTFQQLETLVRGKPETQFSPAEDPDWKELRDLSIELFGQSKHLTASVILTLALLKTEGFSAYRDGLAVVRGLLEQYWDTVYPRLDPEDNNDPTERMNVLNNLAAFDEPYRFIPRLQQVPLCQSPSMGRVTFSDILAARSGASSAPPAGEAAASAAKTGPNTAQIEAAFRDSDPEALKATYDAVAQALETLKAIDTFLNDKVAAGRGANLEELEKTLDQIQKSIGPFVGVATAEAPGEDGLAPVEAQAAGRGVAVSGAIQSREDVVRVLEQVCEYYRQCEPSSPVPLLLKRAQRLAAMDFMQIVNDLTPDAMSQLKVITGAEETPSS